MSLTGGHNAGAILPSLLFLFLVRAVTLRYSFCHLLCIFTIQGIFYLCWLCVLCPLSYVFFSQGCITLSDQELILCEVCLFSCGPLVSSCACDQRTLYLCDQPLLVFSTAHTQIENFIEADSQNRLHFQIGSQDYGTM